MMNAGLKILLGSVVIMILFSGLVYLFFNWYGIGFYPVYFPYIPLFFTGCGIVFSGMVIKSEKKKQSIPAKQLLTTRVARIIGCLVILIGGILADRQHMLSFIILFTLFYIIYLVFETVVMSKLLKKKI